MLFRSQYERVLSLDSAHKEAHYRLGLIAVGQANFKDAEEFFTAAIDIDPQYADAHYNLARLFMKQGSRDAATREMELFRSMSAYNREVESIERILLYLPRDSKAHLQLGQIHEKYQQHDRAIASYRMALSIRPGFQAARQALSAVLEMSESR